LPGKPIAHLSPGEPKWDFTNHSVMNDLDEEALVGMVEVQNDDYSFQFARITM